MRLFASRNQDGEREQGIDGGSGRRGPGVSPGQDKGQEEDEKDIDGVEACVGDFDRRIVESEEPNCHAEDLEDDRPVEGPVLLDAVNPVALALVFFFVGLVGVVAALQADACDIGKPQRGA